VYTLRSTSISRSLRVDGVAFELDGVASELDGVASEFELEFASKPNSSIGTSLF
jgi:hypothetical protein